MSIIPEYLLVSLSGLDPLQVGPIECTVGGIEHPAQVVSIDKYAGLFSVRIEGLYYGLNGLVTPDLFSSYALVCTKHKINIGGMYFVNVKSGIGEYFARLGHTQSPAIKAAINGALKRLSHLVMVATGQPKLPDC